MTTKQKVIKSGDTKKTPKIINQSVENAVAELLSQGNPEDLFGKDGLFQALKKQLVNKILEKEMESHLGYSKHSKDEKDLDNRRNGSYEKTLIDEEGRKVTIDVPRDREGDFEPAIVPKGVRQFKGFDDKVISLYGSYYRNNRKLPRNFYDTVCIRSVESQIFLLYGFKPAYCG